MTQPQAGLIRGPVLREIAPNDSRHRSKDSFWICSVTSEVRLQAVLESHLRNRVTRIGCSGFRFLRTHPRFEALLQVTAGRVKSLFLSLQTTDHEAAFEGADGIVLGNSYMRTPADRELF
jgi:hypothetical protein